MKLNILKFLISFVCVSGFFFLVFFAGGGFAQAATLTASSNSAVWGDTNVPVFIALANDDDNKLIGLNFDLNYDETSFSVRSATAGEAVQSAGKNFYYIQPALGKVRVSVPASNQNIISDGTIAQINFDVLSSSSAGEKLLTLINCDATTDSSKQITLTAVGGKLSVNTPGVGEGSLIRSLTDPKVYLIENGKKRYIPTVEIFAALGYGFADVKTVNQSILDEYLEGAPVSIVDTYKKSPLFKSSAGNEIYALLYNKLHWIPGPNIFDLYGYQWQNIQTVSQAKLDSYPRVRLIRALNDHRIFVLNHRFQKRWIRSATIFDSYRYNWKDVLEILPEELNVYNDNILIKTAASPDVYRLNPTTGERTLLKSMMEITNLNYLPDDITVINQPEMDSYPIKN